MEIELVFLLLVLSMMWASYEFLVVPVISAPRGGLKGWDYFIWIVFCILVSLMWISVFISFLEN